MAPWCAACSLLFVLALLAQCGTLSELDVTAAEESDMDSLEHEGCSLLQVQKALHVSDSRLFPWPQSWASPPAVGAVSKYGWAGQYTLSKPAASFGIEASNAKLHGGGDEIKLFPDKAPQEHPDEVGPERMKVNDPDEACAAGDISGYSILNVTSPALVPFVIPPGHVGRRSTAIIIVPGGQFRSLTWNKEGTKVAKWLNSLGISAFVLKYRVPCDTLRTKIKPVIDAQRAISILRSQSSKFDFESIGLMGFSSGGLVAADVTTSPVRAYPPIDNADQHNYKPDYALLIYATGRPEALSVSVPPTFIALARDDSCTSPSAAQSYFSKLLVTGGNHELHIYSGGKHGYGDCSLYVSGNTWQPVCAWTLNAQLFIEHFLGVERDTATMTYPLVPKD